ncbi:helix-turn-helix transcriptional regulator [Patulibacter sp.]|uniref:helix-turn-helix transcriptional regulator n=1 Tax=Patulibacter sp. TaxID=1912859 RepID=UPI00271C884F|nr:helix-turn-helix transcriptional regulator [Patulibacter sp.]MDO9409683.1 helix-turn-helix transcriptional regulator [Patulibacter sp.]
MAAEERIDLDDLSEADELLLVAALAEREVQRQDREAALMIARSEGYAAGRNAVLAGKPHRPAQHGAATRRKLRDLAVDRERREVEANPDAHPLRVARVALGMSQRDAAALAGLCRRTWWRLENGRGRFSWPTKVAAARAVDKTPAALGFMVRARATQAA